MFPDGILKFRNSMSASVTDMNRVYFLGGSHTEDFSVLSNLVYEWHVPSNTVTMKHPMPVALVDPGVCYTQGYIYVVCGFTNVD